MRRLGQFRGGRSRRLEKRAGKIEHWRTTQGNIEKAESNKERGQRGGGRWENQRSGAKVEWALEGEALKKFIRKKTTVLIILTTDDKLK